MPIYEFKCKCGHSHEEFMMMSAKEPDKCPKCGCKNGKGYSKSFGQPHVIVRGDPKTFGQAAEENAKRLGKEQMQLMAEEAKTRTKKAGIRKLPKGASRIDTSKAKTPPWRDGSMGLKPMDKPLNVKKIKDVKKYIHTGET